MSLSYENSIKYECLQFPSIFVRVMSLLELRILEINSFPYFLYACLQTGRIMVWWCAFVRPSDSPSVRPSGSPSAHFPHFFSTCFDIWSWNFAHDFVLLYYRSSSSVVTLCQFLKELCLFVNLEYRLCAVFRTSPLHALTYWTEILHMTLFHRTTDQVQVSSICINSCESYAPFET